MKSFKKIIVANTITQVIGKGISILASLLLVSMLTRYLGSEGYGAYSLVFIYLWFFSLIADSGMHLLMVRDFSGQQNNQKYNIKDYFLIRCFFVFIALIIASAVINNVSDLGLRKALYIGLIAIAIGSFTNFFVSILTARLKLVSVSVLETSGKIITLIVSYAVIQAQGTLFLLMSAVLIANAIMLALSLLYTYRYFSLSVKYSPINARKIIRESSLIGLNMLLVTFYFKVDTIMLANLTNSHQVGIYSLSYKIFENILVIWGFLMASVYPLLSQYLKSNNRNELKFLIRYIFKIFIILSTVIIIIGLLASKIIIDLLGGSQFMESVIPFRILLFALPFLFANNILYHGMLLYNDLKTLSIVLFCALVTNFILNLYFIPIYGPIGAAFVTILTEIFILCAYFYVYSKKFNIAAKFLDVLN